MGLPWIRLDTSFAHNPKILELIATRRHKAAFVYVCGLAYSGAHGTDGYLPSTCLPFLHAAATDAKQLVSVGLWAPAPGGWQINGWLDCQIADESAKKRRERAQKGAAARWNIQRKTPPNDF